MLKIITALNGRDKKNGTLVFFISSFEIILYVSGCWLDTNVSYMRVTDQVFAYHILKLFNSLS
jgi:hypothetical protein